jgi:peptidyl-prolyl cis-trans isomerase SurA
MIKLDKFVLKLLYMQKNLQVLFLLFLVCTINLFAEDNILFSVGDTKVNKSEFEYIYQKNNFNNKADYSRKSLDDYLNLYVNFRLKVKEALAQELDKNDRFKEELSSYEMQLLDSYVDKEIAEKLIRQEYERSKTDVNVSHIFIAANSSNEKDGMMKAQDILLQLKSGKSFEELTMLSEDKQTAVKGGKLGWFNSYQMSLPEIEEAAYNMKVGEISGIVKTRLGYHILKLNEIRAARPKLKVSIVKRFFPITDTSAKAKKSVEDTIQIAYAKLKANMQFEKVVELYSDDELSKSNKGQLDWFGINTYTKVFEETAYALKDGEYSQPFKTATAWYIVKRQETAKPMSYEESVPLLKSKLQNAPQYQYQMDKYLSKLNEKLGTKSFDENYAGFKLRLNELAQASPFTYRDTSAAKPLLKIGSKIFNENDFGQKIQESFYTLFVKSGGDKYDELIKKAKQELILEHYKNDIKENSAEYKLLMDEYKNGIMIFSLSEKNIWNKASEDSVGLLEFYNKNKTDFNLKKRATVRTVFTDNAEQAKTIFQFINSNKEITDEALSDKMKKLGIVSPKINSQVQSEGKTTVNINLESVSKPVAADKKFQIVQVYNLQPPKVRAFEECRGYVVAAYQEFLEKKWVEELKQKYPVNINTAVFESLVKN